MKVKNRLNPERLSITVFAVFAILFLSMKPAMASTVSYEDKDGVYLEVEEWMTSPFEAAEYLVDEYIEIESWMMTTFE